MTLSEEGPSVIPAKTGFPLTCLPCLPVDNFPNFLSLNNKLPFRNGQRPRGTLSDPHAKIADPHLMSVACNGICN
jgi:hypothetical protein